MFQTLLIPFFFRDKRSRSADLDLSDVDRAMALPVTLSQEELIALRDVLEYVDGLPMDIRLSWAVRRLREASQRGE